MKRITKWIVALLFCVAVACCAIAAGCTVSNAKLYLEGDEGITFNDEYVETDGNGSIYITATRDVMFSVASIPSKCYTLDKGCKLAGWTLYMNGEEYAIPDDETPLAFEFRIDLETDYVLHANVTPAVTMEISLQGPEEGIDILASTVTAIAGEAFKPSTDIPGTAYTLWDGYKLNGWTLYVDGAETSYSSSFTPVEGKEYTLIADLTIPDTMTTITLEGGDGITILTDTINANLGVPFYVASQISNTAYTVWDDYELNGWILYVDDVQTDFDEDGSFTPEEGYTYVLKADIIAPVYATVKLQTGDNSTGVTINEEYAAGVQVKVGTTFEIHISMYELDSEYVIDSWTLTKEGDDGEGTAVSANTFDVEDEDAVYILTPTTAQKTTSISIATADHVSFSSNEIGAHAGYVLVLSTVADMATLDTGYEITGWTITVNDTTTDIEGDTYTVTSANDSYTLTPVLSQYYYVLITKDGMTENEGRITIGDITDDYTGAVKFYVGEEYDLPTEDSSYISLYETYGIKNWSIYKENESELALASISSVKSLDPTESLSLDSYGIYYLVPNVQHYLTVDLAGSVLEDDTTDFEMEQIRVYDGDDFTTPSATDPIITNETGRSVVSWYLEDKEGNTVTVEGGADGLIQCEVNIGELDDYLVIYPVLSDATYPTWVNEVWLNKRDAGGAQVSDHGGTTLGVDSNNDVWHYISDYYTYNKKENVVIYTIYNTGSMDDEKHALSEGFWFRTNTAATDAGITLTTGNYYDFTYCLINYGDVDITLSVYTCSNGYMGHVDGTKNTGSDTNSYASTQHITIKAGETYTFTQYGWYEYAGPDENNFITVFQLDTAVAATDNFVLGIRIGVKEHTSGTTGTLYINDSAEGFTLSGTWTSDTDSNWKSTSIEYGKTVSLAGTSSDDTNTFYVEYALTEGYTLTGWIVTYEDGTTTTYTYTVYDDTHTGANAFTFTDEVMYLTPILTGSST